MTQILAFIAAHMGFLWEEARYHITGSETTTSNGGDAYLLVESSTLRLRFVQDRRQLFLDFQPCKPAPSREWFSVDLIRRMFRGRPETSSLLDESYATFVQDHFDEIESRFEDDSWPTTHAALKLLKKKRAKELFG